MTEAQSIQYVVESRSLGYVTHPNPQMETVPHFCSQRVLIYPSVYLQLENLEKRYSAPGGPQLQYDPEPNTKAEGQRIG